MNEHENRNARKLCPMTFNNPACDAVESCREYECAWWVGGIFHGHTEGYCAITYAGITCRNSNETIYPRSSHEWGYE